MSKIYNTVGSLTAVMYHLQQHKITEFNSLDEIIRFQNNYNATRKKIMIDQQYLLEQEKKILDSEIPELENYISTRKTAIENELIQKIDRLKQQLQNLPANAESNIQGISNFIKKIFLESKIRFREQSFNLIVSISIRRSSNLFAKKKNRYQYLDTQFTDAVNKNCLVPLRDHDRKKE